MASTLLARSFAIITRPTRRRVCLNRAVKCTAQLTQSSQFMTQSSEVEDVPRWKQTPPRMAAPFKHRPNRVDWPVNNDPVKLDNAYSRLLGHGGETLLSEDVKWLAVTHKSFDHGRRGFFDRLAYLGISYTPLNKQSLGFSIC